MLGEVDAQVVRLGLVLRAPHLLEQLALASPGFPGLRTSVSSRCHSVGVRWTSWPSRLTRLAARSMVVGGDHRHLVGGRVAPPDRGPQPGEQLAHAERLGHVVVGAGVEGRDLVGLGIAHRQHDDRHLGPAAQAPRSRRCRRCRAGRGPRSPRRDGARRPGEGLLARGRQVHLVAASGQVGAFRARRIWGSSSTTSTRVMSPSLARRPREADRDAWSARLRGVFGLDRSAHGADEPMGHGQAEPHAVRWCRRGAGTARTADRAVIGGHAGAVVDHPRSTRSPPAGLDATGRPACGAGRWRRRWRPSVRAAPGRQRSAGGSRGRRRPRSSVRSVRLEAPRPPPPPSRPTGWPSAGPRSGGGSCRAGCRRGG
jgi:hypothetical protein